MIPLANKQGQIKFNYINKPLTQTQLRQLQTRTQSAIKIQENVRTSQQKLYKLQGYSSLQLQTRKNISTQKKISNRQIKELQSAPNLQSTTLLQTHQSLHKAQQLDPVLQSTPNRVSIPILRSENVKSDAPKFKIEGLQEIRQSDFFKNDNNGTANNKFNNSTGQQSNQPYNSNPYSNLYGRGGQTQQNEQGGHHHKKRLLKPIKAFKIDKIQEKKQSDFGGCCGFGITNKVAFSSKDK